ncbi:MAG: hypothetical protein ACTSRG_00815 [Candidatus Helarchaeota archaeon]
MSEFYQLSKQLTAELGSLIGVRPYCAIINAAGETCHIDADLEEYSELINNFMMTTFPVLKAGEHSVPISGINMIFFKISAKAMVVLLIKKGALGQLLTFKSLMSKYSSRIDSSIGDIKVTITREIEKVKIKEKVTLEISSETKEEKRAKIKYLPVLIKDLGKTKIPINHARILSLCDGKNDISKIMKQTKETRLFIDQIIRQYQKKGYIKLKRVI